MSRIKIIDLNRHLIQAAKARELDATWADYFAQSAQVPNAVLMTASNPKWTFGGGIDAKFYDHFPDECQEKQDKGGGMERIGNIVFAITVDETLHATPEIIKAALTFALSTLKENETLCISGIGTGIGGLSVKDFCDVVSSLTS